MRCILSFINSNSCSKFFLIFSPGLACCSFNDMSSNSTFKINFKFFALEFNCCCNPLVLISKLPIDKLILLSSSLICFLTLSIASLIVPKSKSSFNFISVPSTTLANSFKLFNDAFSSTPKVYSKPIAIIVSPLSKRKKRRMTQLLDY